MYICDVYSDFVTEEGGGVGKLRPNSEPKHEFEKYFRVPFWIFN
jgi:hypothetical protein